MSEVAVFTPKGEKPRWQYIYELFEKKSVGDVITWSDFASAVPDFDKDRDRSAITKASRELLLNGKHTAVSVRGSGYRIAHGSEHTGLIRQRRTRAARQVRAGRVLAENYDRDEVSAEVAARLDATALVLGRHEHMLRNMSEAQRVLAQRQSELEVARAEDRAEVHKTTSRVDELEAMLKEKGLI